MTWTKKLNIVIQEKHIFTPLTKQSLCKTDFFFSIEFIIYKLKWHHENLLCTKNWSKKWIFQRNFFIFFRAKRLFTLSNNKSNEKICSKYFCGVYGQRRKTTLLNSFPSKVFTFTFYEQINETCCDEIINKNPFHQNKNNHFQTQKTELTLTEWVSPFFVQI